MTRIRAALFLTVYSLSLILASVGLTQLVMHQSNSCSSISSSSEEDVVKGPVAFYPIRPNLEINLPLEGKLRRLEVQVDVMTEDDADALVELQKYEPLIKSELLELLSQSSLESVTTEAGQTALRQKASRAIRLAIKQHTGEDYVKQILFTGFVVE